MSAPKFHCDDPIPIIVDEAIILLYCIKSYDYIYNIVVSRVSAHGRLNITCNFGPHGRLPGI